MKIKTILIYYEQYIYGGVDTHLSKLLNYWPENNTKFLIVSNSDNKGLQFLKALIKNKNVEIKEINFRKNKITFLDKIKFFNTFIYLKTFTKIFNEIIKKEKPMISLINNGGFPGGLTSWVALLISYYSKFTIKTYLLIHHEPQKKLSFNYLFANSISFFIRFINLDVITVSKASKYILEKKTYLSNIKVIYNGMDYKKVNKKINLKSAYNIDQNKVIIGSIGPIEPHKGHKAIIEVFKRSLYLQKNAVFLIVGKGEKNYIEKLKNKIIKNSLENKIILTGFIASESNSIVSEFNIFVMPTIDFEGFGYSLAEAMSQSVPVIVSNVGALPELVSNKKDGFVVNSDDIDTWTRILERLVKNKIFREKIGINGKNTILNKFSAHKMASKYSNLFK